MQLATGRLQDVAIASIVNDTDNIVVSQRAQNLNLLLNQLGIGIIVALQELIPENLECNLAAGVRQVLSKIHFGGIAVTQRLHYLVLTLEDREVCFGSSHPR